MLENRIGEIAALVTAICWTATALSFEAAGRRIGSLAVNIIRLAIAFLIFCVLSLIVRGTPVPVDAAPRVWFWLSLSGIVGFVFGRFVSLSGIYSDWLARVDVDLRIGTPTHRGARVGGSR